MKDRKPKLVSTTEAAKRLRVSLRTFWTLVDRGQITLYPVCDRDRRRRWGVSVNQIGAVRRHRRAS